MLLFTKIFLPVGLRVVPVGWGLAQKEEKTQK